MQGNIQVPYMIYMEPMGYEIITQNDKVLNPFFITKGKQRKNQKRLFFSLVFIPKEVTRRWSENVPIEKNNKTSAWPINGMVMHAMNWYILI